MMNQDFLINKAMKRFSILSEKSQIAIAHMINQIYRIEQDEQGMKEVAEGYLKEKRNLERKLHERNQREINKSHEGDR